MENVVNLRPKLFTAITPEIQCHLDRWPLIHRQVFMALASELIGRREGHTVTKTRVSNLIAKFGEKRSETSIRKATADLETWGIIATDDHKNAELGRHWRLAGYGLDAPDGFDYMVAHPPYRQRLRAAQRARQRGGIRRGDPQGSAGDPQGDLLRAPQGSAPPSSCGSRGIRTPVDPVGSGQREISNTRSHSPLPPTTPSEETAMKKSHLRVVKEGERNFDDLKKAWAEPHRLKGAPLTDEVCQRALEIAEQNHSGVAPHIIMLGLIRLAEVPMGDDVRSPIKCAAVRDLVEAASKPRTKQYAVWSTAPDQPKQLVTPEQIAASKKRLGYDDIGK